MLLIVFWKVVNELNIAFPFVILMSQNHIQRTATAWYLEQPNFIVLKANTNNF